MPCLVLSAADDETRKITLGHPLLDDYLVFVAARARTSTWLAVAYDLKVFFEVVGKEPAVGSGGGSRHAAPGRLPGRAGRRPAARVPSFVRLGCAECLNPMGDSLSSR